MSAKPAKIELCDECRLDFGWHYSDDLVPVATRPHHEQAQQLERARELSAAANEAAMNAGRLILRDVAATRFEFSANQIRDLFDDAGIPDPVVGAVFRWAASDKATADGPLIENTGRTEPSTEATTRHRIYIWRSRVYTARAAS